MRKIVIAITVGIIMSLAFMITATKARAADATVSIQNFAFSPANLTVAPGTTVTWVNHDSAAHTVTSDSSNGPSSGQLQNGQSYSYKFPSAGTFKYHCSIHPQMVAAVSVTAATTPAPPPASQPAGKGSVSQSQSQTMNQSMNMQATGSSSSASKSSLPNTGSSKILLAATLLAAVTAGYIRYRKLKA